MSVKLRLLILVVFLSGCATTAKYESGLNRMIGKSRQEILVAWGEPSRQYSLAGGEEVFEYFTRYTPRGRGYINPGMLTVYRPQTIDGKAGVVTSTRYTPPEPDLKLYCKTTFTLGANNIVKSWRREGNDCVSR